LLLIVSKKGSIFEVIVFKLSFCHKFLNFDLGSKLINEDWDLLRLGTGSRLFPQGRDKAGLLQQEGTPQHRLARMCGDRYIYTQVRIIPAEYERKQPKKQINDV